MKEVKREFSFVKNGIHCKGSIIIRDEDLLTKSISDIVGNVDVIKKNGIVKFSFNTNEKYVKFINNHDNIIQFENELETWSYHLEVVDLEPCNIQIYRPFKYHHEIYVVPENHIYF